MNKPSQGRPAGLAAVALLAALAGCSQLPDAAPAAAPSATVMGATRARDVAAAQCRLRRDAALRAINAARAQPRTCGSRRMAAAPPLRWNLQLYWAANEHALDMAGKDYFEHRSPAGDSVRERVRAQNYAWRHVGENIAAGTETLERTVEAWTESPSHCENLMEPDYVDVALACAERPGTEYEIYWTLVMARP